MLGANGFARAWADWQQCRELATARNDARGVQLARSFIIFDLAFVVGIVLLVGSAVSGPPPEPSPILRAARRFRDAGPNHLTMGCSEPRPASIFAAAKESNLVHGRDDMSASGRL
jgi:hypothetical protein